MDPRSGLSDEEVPRRRAEHGENALPEAPVKSLLSIFLEALSDKTLLILVGAAVLAIGVELLRGALEPGHAPHFIDGIAILSAVLVASGVTTLNDWQAARQFRGLHQLRVDVEVPVRRNGQVRRVRSRELVVGDVVYFDAGDKIPAEGVLLSGAEVSLDRSALTGEAEPAKKGDDDLELEGGSTVVSGSGVMVVTAVGAATEIGRLQASLAELTPSPTPLQERLAKLADRIGLAGLTAAILTFVALVLSGWLRGQFGLDFDLATGARLLEFAIVAVTIVVVAVPEGLPLAVTISLAYSVRRMAQDQNLVRNLASCETMGSATVVCSDKTGTLTENRMTVVAAWAGGSELEGTIGREKVAAAAERIAEVAAVDSTAHLELGDDGRTHAVGNPTEGALLVWAASWGEDWEKRRAEAVVLERFGFSSDRKRMTTVVADGEKRRALVKGAPETILARSARYAASGGDRPLDDAAREEIGEALRRFAEQGWRTLALADRELGAEVKLDAEQIESDLTLLAVVGIADPLRSDVADALAACGRAGVEVKLVTGDNSTTARSIASQVGLLGPDDLVLEGPEFRKKSDEELTQILPRLRVLARSVPSDKLRLVLALKERGEVVAVTGDGTNDGPALRAADVGFAMGVSGTEVAKEASDIILLDDNFSSIVAAISWGRAIFDNIRKFLQFQLTVNVVALSTAFLAALLGYGMPLNTVQLLWVNLIMDTLAALALATEPPTDALLDNRPHGRREPLVSRPMIASIAWMGSIMLVLLIGSLVWDGWVPDGTTGEQRLSFVFNAFVFMQLFNELNARSTAFDRGVFTGLRNSPLFVAVVGVTALLQVLIIEFGGAFFRTVPLGANLWIASVALGALMIPAGAALRLLGRRLGRGSVARS